MSSRPFFWKTPNLPIGSKTGQTHSLWFLGNHMLTVTLQQLSVLGQKKKKNTTCKLTFPHFSLSLLCARESCDDVPKRTLSSHDHGPRPQDRPHNHTHTTLWQVLLTLSPSVYDAACSVAHKILLFSFFFFQKKEQVSPGHFLKCSSLRQCKQTLLGNSELMKSRHSKASGSPLLRDN